MNRAVRTAAKAAFAVADFPYRTRPGPRILIYHQVGAGLGRQMEVTIPNFEFQIQWMLEAGSIVSLDEALQRAGDPDAHRLFVITFDDGYQDVYDVALPTLSSAGVPYTLYVTTQPVETGVASTPGGRAEPLTWDQLTHMAGMGATIGSHTHSHPDLRAIPAAAVEEELAESDGLIEDHLGLRPEHFCYPYGYWSETAEPAVRERYRTATLGGGPPVTERTDPHRIHRVPIQLSDSRFFFVRKMQSGMVFEERLRRRISGYQGV